MNTFVKDCRTANCWLVPCLLTHRCKLTFLFLNHGNALFRYSIYRNGTLDEEVTDVTDYWPKDSVAFLIGCSFSYDGALMNAGIPLKSAEQGKNVPMYKTNLKCRPAGSLSGNMVVSMKPIPALQISKHVSTIAPSILCCMSFLVIVLGMKEGLPLTFVSF